MEDLTKRVPLLNQLILKNIDQKSRVNFKQASKVINQVLENDRFYWILMMNKYHGNFKDFNQSWKSVNYRTPVDNVKQLALASQKFFNGRATRLDQPVRAQCPFPSGRSMDSES